MFKATESMKYILYKEKVNRKVDRTVNQDLEKSTISCQKRKNQKRGDVSGFKRRICFRKERAGMPGWLSLLSLTLDFGSGHDPRAVGLSPTLGFPPSMEPA